MLLTTGAQIIQLTFQDQKSVLYQFGLFQNTLGSIGRYFPPNPMYFLYPETNKICPIFPEINLLNNSSE